MAGKKNRNSEDIIKDINKAIEEEIAPMLRGDGGDIEFVSFDDGVVKVKLQGACRGCPMASFTLKNMVEAVLMDKVPEVKEVKNTEEVEFFKPMFPDEKSDVNDNDKKSS